VTTSRWFIAVFLFVLLDGCQKSPSVLVTIETTMGNIAVELDPQAAPITVENFLSYVDGSFYEGGTFFRTVRMDNQPNSEIQIEVIQGGANLAREHEFFPPIVLERTNQTGIHHKDGVISMARGAPDSAIHSIFICIGDQPSLDFGGLRNRDGQGFGAFGKVISGMDVVRKIQAGDTNKQRLIDPVVIERISRH
jgi:peptidyl-prolyl cis-trans isomerase A (cyclophilin A)